MNPIDPMVLEDLERQDPDLVAKYRQKMMASDAEMKDAQSMKNMAGYAGVAGQLGSDFINSQRSDTVLHNRMQDLGKAPTIQKADRYEWDNSLVDGMADQKMKSARQNREDSVQGMMTEEKLRMQDQGNADQAMLRDPKSEASMRTRAAISKMIPGIEKEIPTFEKMSAFDAERIMPHLKDKWQSDRDDAMKRTLLTDRIDDKRERQVETDMQKLSKDIAGAQGATAALDEVEGILGFKVDDADVSGEDLKVQGKKLDLPGVSVPGIGRVSAYSGKARDLQGAAARVFNVELKDRSGAAVTNPELQRLKTEFGEGKFNNEKEMVGALQRYKRALKQELQNREAAYNKEVVSRYKDQGARTSETISGGQNRNEVQVRNSDTGETLVIPREDLKDAENDGFVEVK